jgi:hypothetical protein
MPFVAIFARGDHYFGLHELDQGAQEASAAGIVLFLKGEHLHQFPPIFQIWQNTRLPFPSPNFSGTYFHRHDNLTTMQGQEGQRMAKQTNGSHEKSARHAEESARHAETAKEYTKRAEESARETQEILERRPEAHREELEAVKKEREQIERTAEQTKKADEEAKKTAAQVKRTARVMERSHDAIESKTEPGDQRY